jgi:hypothetical protein
MDADVHAPEDGCKWYGPDPRMTHTLEEMRTWDVWMCMYCIKHEPGNSADGMVFDRSDKYIKDWIKDHAD